METMTMNIDTLLEAAIFLETRSGSQGLTNAKARAKSASFHPYAKAPGKAPTSSEEPNGSEDMGEAGVDLDYSPSDDFLKDRRRAGGAGTREVHNKLEKNRRAHLKECFERLKRQIPNLEDKRTSNLAILRYSLRYIQVLKRKEKELVVEMRLVEREKARSQSRITRLKRDLAAMNVDMDINAIVTAATLIREADDSASDTTATADNESPIVSEAEGNDPDEDDGPDVTMKQEVDSDRKPHVPVKATLPAIQTPPATATSLDPPKPLAVNASSPIVINPQHQPLAHTVLAMPSARALSSISKVMPTTSQPIVALQAGAANVSLAPGGMTGTVLGPVASPGQALSSSPAPGPASGQTGEPQTGAATFKTPVAQILHQTIAQRALAQHLQQHQVRLQQQQQQQQQQTHPSTPQAPKVFAVHSSALRQTLPSLSSLRQTVTMNHLVPSLLAPGSSILATPGGLTPAQMGSLTAAVGKVADSSGTPVVVSVSSTAPFTTTTNTVVSSTQAMSPAVTFTTVKPFLTPQQIPTQIMSFSSLGQLISQGATAQRGATTVQPRGVAVAGAVTGATCPVTMAGLTPVTSSTMVTVPSANNTVAQQQHPVMASLTHMAPAGTQIMAPLSMVTSQTGLNPASLSQAQLSLVNSPILRSLGHIPIQLQQPFGLGQLVKPVVMVSVPSVVTTSQPSTGPVQLPVTHTS